MSQEDIKSKYREHEDFSKLFKGQEEWFICYGVSGFEFVKKNKVDETSEGAFLDEGHVLGDIWKTDSDIDGH